MQPGREGERPGVAGARDQRTTQGRGPDLWPSTAVACSAGPRLPSGPGFQEQGSVTLPALGAWPWGRILPYMQLSRAAAHRSQVSGPNHKKTVQLTVLGLFSDSSLSGAVMALTLCHQGVRVRAAVLLSWTHLPQHCLPAPISSLEAARSFLSPPAV